METTQSLLETQASQPNQAPSTLREDMVQLDRVLVELELSVRDNWNSRPHLDTEVQISL